MYRNKIFKIAFEYDQGQISAIEAVSKIAHILFVAETELKNRKKWKIHRRLDSFAKGLVEAVCEHGVGHPIPESVKYLDAHGPIGARGTWDTHGCDGCCTLPSMPQTIPSEI